MEIPIKFISDDKGYFDRECPNENCLYTFKIYMRDWDDKIAGSDVHCPMCGHIAGNDSWWTQEQLEAIQEAQVNYAMSLIHDKLDEAFGTLARSTKNNEFVKITYKPGKRVSFSNNPIGQREEWETEIVCEQCNTKYSVIGSAFFCPCCGYNSAINVFEESLDSTEKMLDALPEMQQALTTSYGKDKAETICRGLKESTLGDIVSAFQKFAEAQYKKVSTKTVRVNDFQIVEKGSCLFLEATGNGYEQWLSSDEINRMNVLFQRRHIIEHNGGIVDERYLAQSNDTTYNIGQRIIVHVADAKELLDIIRKLSTGLKTII